MLLRKTSCKDQEEIATFVLVKCLGREWEENLLPVQGRQSRESCYCRVDEAYSAGTRFTPDQFMRGLFQGAVFQVGNNFALESIFFTFMHKNKGKIKVESLKGYIPRNVFHL